MINPVVAHHLRAAMRYQPWRTITVMAGVTITTIVGHLITPLIVASIIDAIQHDRATLAALTPALFTFAGARIYTSLIGWRINAYLMWSMQIFVEQKLLVHIHDTLMRHSLAFHSNRMGGTLISRANKFLFSFDNLWDMILLNLIPTVIIVSGTIIISFVIYPFLGLTLLIASLIYVGAVAIGSRNLRRLSRDESEAHSKISGILADGVGNIAAVKAFSSTQFEQGHLRRAAEVWRHRGLAHMWYFLKISSVYTTIMSAATITVAIVSIYAAEHHVLQLSLIYLAFTYALNMSQQLWTINGIFKTYYNVIGQAEEMLEILDEPVEIQDKDPSVRLDVQQGQMTLQDVSFSYEPEKSLAILNSIDLSIPSGQKVGIVGHSGAGKTTLSKLLLRFIEPTSGTITIDNQDITAVTQDSLREAIAYVPQEPLLFHRSLRDNIAYGKRNASDGEVIAAAKKAHAWEFIKDLPDQLETIVGERGIKLSGGQRQRIAIARAIIKQAPILLLDEATSALDSESEKLIQSSLQELMAHRTTIVIAHRLSTIQKMDRIIVLDQGRIVEDGTHAALLKQKGIYATLWQHQSGGFIVD